MNKKDELYVYVRVSTEQQVGKGFSLEEQIVLGKRKAKELGMKAVICSEKGISASGDEISSRPELLGLIKKVKEGIVKNIFVFDQTRLSRNEITRAILFRDLSSNNVRLFTKDKEYDFKSLEDELVYKIMGVIADYDSSIRKARFQLGTVQANRQGKFTQHIPPYGYKKDDKGYLVIEEEEKEIVLKIVEWYLNGEGTGKIVKRLNEMKVPTKTQKVLKNGYKLNEGKSNRKISIHKKINEWNPGTINSMLKNTVYFGKRKFKNGQEYEMVDCPAIISEPVFNRIQIIRSNNSIGKRKEDKYFYLLKNLLQCSCGSNMHGRIKPNRGEYTYRCSTKRYGKGCGARGININKLNDLVWFLFTYSKSYRSELKNEIKPYNFEKEIKRLGKLQESLEKQKQRLISQLDKSHLLLVEEVFSKAEYKKVKVEYSSKLKDLEVQILDVLSKLNTIESKKDNQNFLNRYITKFINAGIEVEQLYNPDSSENMESVKNILNNYISNIIVEWDIKNRTHNIEINFHDSSTKKGTTKTYKNIDLKKQIELNKNLLEVLKKEYGTGNIKGFHNITL